VSRAGASAKLGAGRAASRNSTAVDEYLAEPGPSGLFTRLARVGLLLQGFQERCLDPHGLKFIDFSVLRVLFLAGPPYRVSPTRLAEIVLRPTGGMTQILDRLERDGLVTRSLDPSDRRKVDAGLTEKGSKVAERAGRQYAEARTRLLAGLSSSEVRQIDRAIRRLLEVFANPGFGEG
jgi:DNA-binding MarR family transcriptional regulator